MKLVRLIDQNSIEKEPIWKFEELFSPQEKPITVNLSILPVRQDRNHFFYPNIWSISYQTNLQR